MLSGFLFIQFEVQQPELVALEPKIHPHRAWPQLADIAQWSTDR